MRSTTTRVRFYRLCEVQGFDRLCEVQRFDRLCEVVFDQLCVVQSITSQQFLLINVLIISAKDINIAT